MKNSNELSHHGILGQKWGVRRFQNEDGSLTAAGKERYGYGPLPNERTVLKKGTRLNSVSILGDSEAYRKSGNWTYTYNPDDDWDRKVYNGAFSYYKNQMTGRLTFEHSYEVVKDLKMPTSAERFDEFVKLYEKETKTVTKDLKLIQDQIKNYQMGDANKKAQTVNLKNIKTDEDLVAAYKLFNHAMENVAAFKSTKMYAEIMSQKYDAMVDDNNQGGYNEAHDPIIIFNATEALRTVSSARLNTPNDIMSNYWDIKLDLMKRGKKLSL